MRYLILMLLPLTCLADDPHHDWEYSSTITHKSKSETIGTALSLSVAAQQYDFNSNRRQWSLGAGRFGDANAVSVGIGGTVRSGEDRLLLNGGIGIEEGRVGWNVGVNGRW